MKFCPERRVGLSEALRFPQREAVEGKGQEQQQGRGGRREAKQPTRRAERRVLRSAAEWPHTNPWVALRLVSRQAVLTNHVTRGQ